MKNIHKAFLFEKNSLSQDIGFLLLRFFVGLAIVTVFEKFLPKNGIWGPQEWFIQDTAKMGFPFPILFAWVAVLSEFFGGILLMLGLLTRPAALLNFFVTFTATFFYHNGDIGNSGLISFFFMIMCLCIVLFGPGKFSVDHLLVKNFSLKSTKIVMIVMVLLAISSLSSRAFIKSIVSHPSALSAESPEIIFYLKNKSGDPLRVPFRRL